VKEDLFRQAQDFANAIGPERVVGISHSEDKDDGVVAVWAYPQAGPQPLAVARLHCCSRATLPLPPRLQCVQTALTMQIDRPAALFVALTLTDVVLAGSAAAADRVTLPGLAAKYPGDVGIAKDPAVLFHDDFETDTPGALRSFPIPW
jgi:hypothetical protein